MTGLRSLFLQSDRTSVEKYISERTRSQYIGNGNLICQILGANKMYVIGEDVGFSSHMIFDGYWEFWLSKYFAQNINPGDTVIDIGANLGYYTLLASDLVSDEGRVISVEPNPKVFNLLSASIAVNGYRNRVQALNIAIGEPGEDGFLPFFVPRGEPKNGCFIAKQSDHTRLRDLGDVIEVQLGSLEPDQFDRVDFIKIDVEGAELSVLRNLKPIFQKFHPKLVCEVNFARGYTYDDLTAVLGTSNIHYLDFHSCLHPLTREMCEEDDSGEDWLVCVDFKTPVVAVSIGG